MTETIIEYWVDRIEDLLDGQLGAGGGVIPAELAEEFDELDPRVFVGATLDASERNNKKVTDSVRVRVGIDATEGFVSDEGAISLYEIKRTVIDELERHRKPWSADGVDSDTLVRWDSDLERHICAVEATGEFRRFHAAYED